MERVRPAAPRTRGSTVRAGRYSVVPVVEPVVLIEQEPLPPIATAGGQLAARNSGAHQQEQSSDDDTTTGSPARNAAKRASGRLSSHRCSRPIVFHHVAAQSGQGLCEKLVVKPNLGE
jgi:hypothetical protein